MMRLLITVTVWLAFVASTVAQPPGEGLWIVEENNFDPVVSLPKFSRFETGFIGGSRDFSGAGRTTVVTPTDQICDHGTLISPSFHVAAHHSQRHPLPGEDLRFYYNGVGPGDDLEDPNNFEERMVTDSWLVTDSLDLQVGKLITPVSSGVAVYPLLLMEDLTDYADLDTFYFGKRRGSTSAQRHHRVARSIVQEVPVSIFAHFYPVVQLEDGYAVPGDSGSPTFVANSWGGSWGPILVGVHYAKRFDSIVTPEVRDALRQDMLGQQNGIAVEDQEVPTYWTGIYGDFDGSFSINPADADIILREVAQNNSRGYNWYLDWNIDGSVDSADADLALGPFGINKKRGDIDMDDDVDFADFLVLNANFGTSTGMGWADGDGDVDFADYLQLSANWTG